MANHFSALKRARQNRKLFERNRTARTRLRHAIREFRRALSARDTQRARALLSGTVSLIDKSLKKGIIKENAAARFKHRLMTHLNRVAAGS